MDRSAHITIIGALSLALAACHVTRHNDVTLSGATKYQLHKGQRMVLAPRLEITRAGRFRLVEPIMCRRDILVEQVTHRDAIKKPNYATVVVGLLSGAAGVVALISALGDSSGVLVGGGLVGVGIGLPLTIGPFTGNTRKRRFVGVELSKRGRDFKRCAARALKVTRATLRHDKQRVHAVVDTNGELDVRVFDVFDAFAVHRLPAVEIDVQAGATRFKTMLSASDIAAARTGFFKAIRVDASKPRLDKVPQPRIDSLTVMRTHRAGRVTIELRAKIRNHGIGDAWGVRGVITSNNPEIDGRVLYVGHLPAKASRTATSRVSLSTDEGLDDAYIALVLFDHHRTTRRVPIRFRGPILNAM